MTKTEITSRIIMLLLEKLLILFLFIISNCRGQDTVTQSTGDVTAMEGEHVTLGCTFQTSDPSPYMFWYKQEFNGFPKFILQRNKIATGNNDENFDKERFSSQLTWSNKSVPLMIHKLQFSDSAVYYCALRPGGGTKIIFGSGIKLSILTEETKDPSFYRLGHNETEACLATDFSHHNALNNTELFQGTNPARADGDKFYSQVALIGDNEASSCSEGPEKETDHCDADYFEPDWKVNFLSMTMLALRILFLKTVVFNVLMTLKVWMS